MIEQLLITPHFYFYGTCHLNHKGHLQSHLFVMCMKLKKQVSEDTENLPNFASENRAKPFTKSMNFGKSIKLKAQMLQEPHGLKEQVNGITQSVKFQETPVQQGKMKMRKRASFDEEDFTFKSKMVRFEDEESFEDNSSLQYSRNRKKNPSILKKSPSVDKQSVNSGTSDLGGIDFFPGKSLRNPEGVSANEKYQKTVKMLKYQNVKFVDNLFPPGLASLCYSKPKMAEFSKIRWMRLEQLFKNRKLVLFNNDRASKCTVRRGCLNYSDSLVTALNAVSNGNRCLQRMIEEQKVFGLCIYYVRINHDGVWKYVVVDDYVPVVRTRDGDVPAFLNVQENSQGEIEIWPFLAQKALAKLYNCYECIFEDSAQNLVFEFTGVQCEELNLREETSQFKFRSSVLHSQTVILASKPANASCFPEPVYALREDCELNENTYFNLDIRLRIIDPNQNRNLVFDLGDISKLFSTVKVFRIDESTCSLGCIIKQTKDTISLRKFTIKERACACTLSLIQKDKKYYRNNGYQYVWARMMVMTRDGSNGYRWIAGKYDNSRIITLACVLEPGQYYVSIAGDWKNRAYEMVLNYQGCEEIEFSRDTFQNHPKIIIETCVDLAQRFGTFKQLNRNLCAYRLIDHTNGFIIQNVNNQANRQVFFHKTYALPKSLKSKYELLQRKLYLQDEQSEIQTLVEPNSHFTFIVKLIDGLSCPELSNFSFDS